MKGRDIGIIALVGSLVLLAVLYMISNGAGDGNHARKTTGATPEQASASHQLIAELTATGFITKIEEGGQRIFVDPLQWQLTPYEQKKNLAIGAMIHFEDRGYPPNVEFLDNYSGQKLGSALWGWGFKCVK